MEPSTSFSFGIARKPTFLHALFLFKEFKYRPVARECKHTKHCRQIGGLYKQRTYSRQCPYRCKYPPAPCAYVVFRFYYDGVKHSDAYECRQPEDDSFKIHLCVSISVQNYTKNAMYATATCSFPTNREFLRSYIVHSPVRIKCAKSSINFVLSGRISSKVTSPIIHEPIQYSSVPSNSSGSSAQCAAFSSDPRGSHV